MEIKTSARLHLSLIDLNGLEGRVDGGIGITLENPSLIMNCIKNDSENEIIFDKDIPKSITQDEEYVCKILEATQKMNNFLKSKECYKFNIKKIYPAHHGLGLGTQLLLSTGKLISKLHDVELPVYDIAKIIQRGGTSGIGTESFNSGGFIVDGGHKTDKKTDFLPSSASKVAPPPVLARYDFPDYWNILLAMPNVNQRISGNSEVNIFQEYSPINIRDVEKISYLTLMKLMPAIIEHDIESFGDAVKKIQNLGFKKVERSLQSNITQEIITFMDNENIPCTGMSSFGPTCFGITENDDLKDIKKDLMELMNNNGSVLLTKGKNHGFKIKGV